MIFYINENPTDKRVDFLNETIGRITIVHRDKDFCLLDKDNNWIIGVIKPITQYRAVKVLANLFRIDKREIELHETVLI